ncbi:MAG: hypothetical protein ABIO79_13055 [Ferruginibacter sp.]
MKKLLLSSIIMFGICGFVTAQNATDSKLAKKSAATTTSATATPQKSAVEATPTLTTNADAAPASDKVNQPAAVAPTGKPVRVAKTDAAAAISADGTVQPTNDLQKKEAARSVAPVKKN